MIDNFKIYSVSDKYIDFLRKRVPNVYSNKQQKRTHTRKYIGVALKYRGLLLLYSDVFSERF